jgi:hypothetical protein
LQTVPAIERLVSIIRAARQVAIQPEAPDWRGPIVVVSALAARRIGCWVVAAEAGAGDIDGARDHLKALCDATSKSPASLPMTAERAAVESFITQEFDALDRVVGCAGRTTRSVAALARHDCGDWRNPEQPQSCAAALSSRGLAASWVDARQGPGHQRRPHERHAALAGDRRRAAEDGGSRVDCTTDSCDWRLRRRNQGWRDDHAR